MTTFNRIISASDIETGELVGIYSIKPIFSENDTVDFIVPLTWTVYQFLNFATTKVSSEWLQFAHDWSYAAEFLPVGQPETPWEARFGVPDPRWTACSMSEYAPSIGYYAPSGIIGEVYGERASFYVRRSTQSEDDNDPMYAPVYTIASAWSNIQSNTDLII
jgi:hypothetical protein